jgi:hypothetical protein
LQNDVTVNETELLADPWITPANVHLRIQTTLPSCIYYRLLKASSLQRPLFSSCLPTKSSENALIGTPTTQLPHLILSNTSHGLQYGTITHHPPPPQRNSRALLRLLQPNTRLPRRPRLRLGPARMALHSARTSLTFSLRGRPISRPHHTATFIPAQTAEFSLFDTFWPV